MNKPSHNLIAIKTKKKRRAKFIARNFAQDTYDFNSAGEKILIDHLQVLAHSSAHTTSYAPAISPASGLG